MAGHCAWAVIGRPQHGATRIIHSPRFRNDCAATRLGHVEVGVEVGVGVEVEVEVEVGVGVVVGVVVGVGVGVEGYVEVGVGVGVGVGVEAEVDMSDPKVVPEALVWRAAQAIHDMWHSAQYGKRTQPSAGTMAEARAALNAVVPELLAKIEGLKAALEGSEDSRLLGEQTLAARSEENTRLRASVAQVLAARAEYRRLIGSLNAADKAERVAEWTREVSAAKCSYEDLLDALATLAVEASDA